MDKPVVSKTHWKERFKGWFIVDVAVRDRNTIGLCLRKKVSDSKRSRMHDAELPTRLVVVRLDQPSEKPVSLKMTGMNRPIIGACLLPSPGLMVVSRDVDGYLKHLIEKTVTAECIHEDSSPLVERLKMLDGIVYSIGGGRKIYRREEADNWIPFSRKELPHSQSSIEQGFEDFDWFSPTDAYGVGGDGDVWHFNGSEWSNAAFPTNEQLATVTCAGNGKVYITGEGGSIWEGRETSWTQLYKGGSSILWNDAIWFNDELWLSSDYQLRVWRSGNLQNVTEDGQKVSIWGHMESADGLLAVASAESVMVYDGKTWTPVVHPYVFK